MLTTLIGSSISFAHAEPKMSGTIYIMTEVEHNNKTGVTNTTISDKSSSLYLSDEVRLNNDLWLKWQLGSFIYFDSDRWGGWGTADSYVALNSYKNLGTVKMGYISTPMNSIYLNPFDTNSSILEFGKISRFGQRRVSMAYESPWKNGFQFKFNVSPGSNAARNNNDWSPDKKRDGDWVFGWGVDYYHPSNGFNAPLRCRIRTQRLSDRNQRLPSPCFHGRIQQRQNLRRCRVPIRQKYLRRLQLLGRMERCGRQRSRFLRQRNQQHQRIYGVRFIQGRQFQTSNRLRLR